MSANIVVLTGGVGGAKLVLGLQEMARQARVTALVNTGDDFTHLGLHISPDIDTLLYTLSGKANLAQGWGRESESWSFMSALRELGGDDWFQLGDGDLALHIMRSMRMRRGETLSVITADFAEAWGIPTRILPMSEQEVATYVHCDEGVLPFQHYFVARRCEPVVSRIEFRDAASALPASGVLDAIVRADVILIAPSNPYLSIDPLLSVEAIRNALSSASAPVVAVSPLIKGQAVKGPTAKLMQELGLPVTNAAIASHYRGLVDAMVIDSGDDIPEGIAVQECATLMKNREDRIRVAQAALACAMGLRKP